MLPTRLAGQTHFFPLVLKNTIHLLFFGDTVIPPTVRGAFCTLSILMKASDISGHEALSHALQVCCVQCNKKIKNTGRICIRLQTKTSAAVNKTAGVMSSRAENS